MDTARTVEEIGHIIGLRPEGRRRHGWLEHVVRRRTKRSQEKARAKRAAGAYADVAPEERARSVVRWACAKVAVTGLLSGAAATSALVATVETEGLLGFVALPFGAVAIGAEMVARTIVQVDLACELAEIFGVKSETADDVVRLLSLAASSDEEEVQDEDDLGQAQLRSATVDREALLERAAQILLGESLIKNVVPFLGIVASSVTNVIVTRRLGRAIRRSFRYERAVLDALRGASGPCDSCTDLLVEGLWFVFTADGRLRMEEAACLAQRLDDLDEGHRQQLLARFVSDEGDWLNRLRNVPEPARDTFLRVLEVAAALDKSLALPQQKILRRVADAFHRPYDPRRVKELVEQFEETGVVSLV